MSENTITKNGYTINKSSIDSRTLKNLKKELTVKPKAHPDFDEGLTSFEVFWEDDVNIYIPRYYGVGKFGKAELKLEKETDIDIKFKGGIRPYQVDIINTCMNILTGLDEHKLDEPERNENIKYGGGLISLSCGLGKTVIAINLAVRLKVKTLVLVHTGRLLGQWIERVSQFTDAKIGMIRQDKIDVEDKDIVIGMLQSVSMREYDEDIFSDFGLLVCDEAHHFPSRVFSRALKKITTKYTIALSATPERKDGLTKILHWYMGDLMYKLIRDGDKGVIVNMFNYESSNKDKFKIKKRWINGSVKPDTIKMTSNICMLEERNIFITNIITHLRNYSPDRQILVLSMRIEQLEILKKLTDKAIKKEVKRGVLEKGEYRASLYIGKMKDYELDDAVSANVLFATFHIAKEGLDIDTLNTLILATPIKDVVQASGRILRKTAESREVQPMIIDIFDNLQLFNNWGQDRLRYYKKNEYSLNKYRAYDDNIISMRKYLKQHDVIQSEDISDAELRKAYITKFYGEYEYKEDLEEDISYYDNEFSYVDSLDVLEIIDN